METRKKLIKDLQDAYNNDASENVANTPGYVIEECFDFGGRFVYANIPTWAPSDAEMEALSKAVSESSDPELKRLHRELKRLRNAWNSVPREIKKYKTSC